MQITTPNFSNVLSVVPMMDWTNRHDRYFLRLFNRLHPETVATTALIHGDTPRLLKYDAIEHPLALQLGGAYPAGSGPLREDGGGLWLLQRDTGSAESEGSTFVGLREYRPFICNKGGLKLEVQFSIKPINARPGRCTGQCLE